jgi:hypothetical protein
MGIDLSQLKCTKVNTSLAGAVLTLALGLVGHMLFVHGPLAATLARRQAIERVQRIRGDVVDAQRQCTDAVHAIQSARQRLDAANASLASAQAPGVLLARVNELADACGIEVERWQPLGVEARSDYRIQKFVIEGRASYPDVYRWLTRMEAELNHVDVTHLSLHASNDQNDRTCTFTCSLRSYTPQQEAASAQLARGDV